MVLPDLLQDDLTLVFCGTAAGDKSAKREAYYAGKGNLFYPTLSKCNLTPMQLQPEEYPKLVEYKIGLTDLAKHVHGMDKDLKADDFDTDSFQEKILKYQPQVVCFNGKEAARVYLKLKDTKQVSLGLQQVAIGKTKLFVAPSTSIKAFAYWDESYWLQLKTFF